ncbi:MAG: homoserine dehydrogenase [Peptostreptococcaceae bacterium]
MNLGIIGFGGVGKAFIELIQSKRELISNLKLKYIIKSNGGLYNSEGLDIEEIYNYIKNNKSIEKHELFKNITIDDVIENKDIDCLIELTSTNIQDGQPGYNHIKKALSNNINVVTGNKGPIVLYYSELKEIANKSNVHLKIGCTTGGALPSINVGIMDTLGSEVLEIQGVLNGTTNFIIEEMANKKIEYQEALKEAQRLKIAEANPELDVKGYDTAIKTLILAKAVMNVDLSMKDITIDGITDLKLNDVINARNNNCKVKLVGSVIKNQKDIIIEVKPIKIDDSHPLYSVDGKNKGVYYKTDTLGDITVIGGASGTINAAASIMRDLLSIKKG